MNHYLPLLPCSFFVLSMSSHLFSLSSCGRTLGFNVMILLLRSSWAWGGKLVVTISTCSGSIRGTGTFHVEAVIEALQSCPIIKFETKAPWNMTSSHQPLWSTRSGSIRLEKNGNSSGVWQQTKQHATTSNEKNWNISWSTIKYGSVGGTTKVLQRIYVQVIEFLSRILGCGTVIWL